MSNIICTNCHGQSTAGCWLCNPTMNTPNTPPIPLPEFDVWEQLGKARNRICELETEIAVLKKSLEEQSEDFYDMLAESGYFYKS